LPALFKPRFGEHPPTFRTELHRFRNAEGGRQGKALMDELDPGLASILDVAARKRAAVYLELAGCWADEASQNPGKGRLACTVLADDGVDHATFENGSNI
jgi:hypothetical protein